MLRVINSVGVSYEWVGLRSLSRDSFEGARTSNKLEMHALQVIFPLVLFSVVAGKPAELVLLHGGPSMVSIELATSLRHQCKSML